MNYKTRLLIGVIGMILSITLLIFAYTQMSYTFLFVGGLFLVLSILYLMIMMSLNLFIEDKKLNIEALKKQGLTIVTCSECQKDNVLEDKYCIHCGNELKNNE